MTVRHEIKSQLAKLLATEDLVVEHRQIETAQFNVHTRVLTLPKWERASSDVYDMLVGHEVGHALYTPDENWLETHKIPPQFVNIVEDVRIEKMMKRRYAGISKTFYRGYQELAEEDFFQIGDEDISTYNLADKVNLYYKIGNFVDVPFDDDEKELVSLIGETETFVDVLSAAWKLYRFCKEKQKEETKIQMDNLESQQTGGNQPASDFSDQPEGENDNDQEQPGETDSFGGTAEDDRQPTTSGGETNEEPEVKTAEALEEALKDLIDKNSEETVYLEIPKLNLDKVIIPNLEIHQRCEEAWSSSLEKYEDEKDRDIFDLVDQKYLEFKKSAQREVNYLVKEFECKKAADSYARATTARTGVLDCSKLHTYKYNEDLFKKVTTLAEGKNHGLVFVLDWSGSMSQVMMDTIKQLYNLIWFCKKVGIPFEVYAFTSDYPRFDLKEGRDWAYERKHGKLHVPDYFSMMNILSSKVNSKTLEVQMKSIFRTAYAFNHYVFYFTPYGMGLSGTPLNEALISLHQILPKFKQENKLQKVQCVILTDGEACMTKYDRELNRHWEDEPFLGTASIRNNAFLRDRKIGHTYSLDCEWYEMTDILIRNLRDHFKDINFIGIRVLESRDSGSFIRRYCGYYGETLDKTMNSWKKNKSFTITTSGYHKYFGLSANALAQDAEFEVAESATKTQIKSAFVKSLKSKKMNKKILGEFVELIA